MHAAIDKIVADIKKKNMNKLKIELQNCYGIKKLNHEFDFSSFKTFVIYAPNGVMKTSFAKTLNDIANKKKAL